MSRKGNNCGGTNRHHRMTKCAGGRDNCPPNNIAIVPVCRHNLWNQIFHGAERIEAVVNKINVMLAKFGIQVRAEKIY
jgi:hypothetical protein